MAVRAPSAPSAPPPPPPPPPTPQAPTVSAAAEAARRRALMSKGSASTIIPDAEGAAPAGSGKAQLLGE